MDVTFLTRWISEPQVKAICWALIHSLWIGLLVAALAGLVMILTQKTSSHLRYQLLCGCLLLFVLLTGYVYYQLANATSNRTAARIVPKVTSTMSATLVKRAALAKRGTSFINQFVRTINYNAQWIFAAWLLFFALKSLKLISGLVYIRRIRTHRISAADDEWQQKVQLFSQQLGIRQSVSVLQSPLVKVPVTVGMLKPVILVPVGLFFQLPVEQLDTILWHELAHVWRRDYLMNLLQSLVEAVFFFNPGLLWLSALIREEREICCDDIVLARTSRKSNYLEALLAFQESPQPTASFAMSLGFRNQQLIDRLRRMVTQENKRLSVAEKLVLLSGLVILLASAFVPRNTADIRKKSTQLKMKSEHIAKKKDLAKPNRANVRAASLRMSFQPENLEADTLPVISAKSVIKIDSNLNFTQILFERTNADMANREMRVKDDKGNRYHLKIANDQLIALDVNDVAIASTDLPEYYGLLRQIDQAFARKRQQKQELSDRRFAQIKAERAQFLLREKEARQTKLDRLKQQNPGAMPSKDWPHLAEGKKLRQAEFVKKEWQLDTKKKSFEVKTDLIAHQQIQPKKKLPEPPNISYDQERVRGVIAALVAEKVVPDATSVDWFGLSTDELIVNGQKQPDVLQKRLKEQYGIAPNYGLYYGPGKMYGKGIIIDKEDLSR
ncbi:M56 family metallopeptidase [Spirosoma sp. BT702]|uniref:M56 family metallopeptidase n=1 Tax=Spirosoma profusum TaxID=2771354 RepID=A0A927AS46_9BACT|nr:M56 family metallopeptidase [Spirosoma profusum]MBD2703286.1 M56 family metallopeptidase [Spirosoma profusum]